MREEIIHFLEEENARSIGLLIPVNISEYVDKIFQHATLLSFYRSGTLCGLIAFYCNDPKKETAFLTMLCVAPETAGSGIGSILLQGSISDIRQQGFRDYALEVNEYNSKAIALYQKAGFETVSASGGNLTMKKDLQ